MKLHKIRKTTVVFLAFFPGSIYTVERPSGTDPESAKPERSNILYEKKFCHCHRRLPGNRTQRRRACSWPAAAVPFWPLPGRTVPLWRNCEKKSRKPGGRNASLFWETSAGKNFVTSLFSLLPEEACLKVLVNNAGISHVGLLQEHVPGAVEHTVSDQCNFHVPYLPGGDPSVSPPGRRIYSQCIFCLGTCGRFLRGSLLRGQRSGKIPSPALWERNWHPAASGSTLSLFGAVDTSMNQFLSPEERRALEEEIPAGRFGTPAEAGALIADLSLNHPYLTGQVITMDGAWI